MTKRQRSSVSWEYFCFLAKFRTISNKFLESLIFSYREKLRQVFDLVQEVNILDSRDEANLRLLKRPELGITFTKLHCWRLTQFDKCVFLDADTLVCNLFLLFNATSSP